jgi:hypothetical protein
MQPSDQAADLLTFLQARRNTADEMANLILNVNGRLRKLEKVDNQ